MVVVRFCNSRWSRWAWSSDVPARGIFLSHQSIVFLTACERTARRQLLFHGYMYDEPLSDRWLGKGLSVGSQIFAALPVHYVQSRSCSLCGRYVNDYWKKIISRKLNVGNKWLFMPLQRIHFRYLIKIPFPFPSSFSHGFRRLGFQLLAFRVFKWTWRIYGYRFSGICPLRFAQKLMEGFWTLEFNQPG